MQLRGVFDLPESTSSRAEWNVDLPLEERDWHIGLIVGPSGCGKSTIAQHLWPKEIAAQHAWDETRSVVDSFPDGMGIKEITGLLSAVGFSSPPSWLRPFGRLSNGEQFRVSVARTLAEQPELAVIDEFTSVVDRTVAQIGSAAVASTVRRRGQRLIAVTCHQDVEAWLTPDWVYEPAINDFRWGCLQRRPEIGLQIGRVPSAAWELFRKHHYLNTSLNRSAVCFGAFYGGRMVAFAGWLPIPRYAGRRRVTRVVCLPDYQGVGIGNALVTATARMWRGLGVRPSITSSHPAVIRGYNRAPDWAMFRTPQRSPPRGRNSKLHVMNATRRLVASFEFVGEAMTHSEAEALLRSRADLE